jgi:DNA modification methylase
MITLAVSRKTNLVNGNETVASNNKLNDLTAREWLPETISVWTQRGLGKNHPDAKIEKEHPAPFSFTDVSRLIRFFTKKGQTVLDPFVGIGSTLKACALEGRKGIGIELNPKYVKLTQKRLEEEVDQRISTQSTQRILQGDCRIVLDEIESSSIDFMVTSPPYWCILHKIDHKAKQERKAKNLDTQYTNLKNDLGNIQEYDVFLKELTEVFRKCSRVLKPQKYIAIVVGDFREKGRYHMFHADLANKLEEFNLILKGITILYQRHKRVFPYGYPAAYVPNLHHQYILILKNEKEF